MRIIQTTILSALLALAALAAQGCLAVAAGAAAGAGTYAYVQGEMSTTFEASLDRTWAATRAAVDQLEFAAQREAKDALTARLSARQADGRSVTIRLERVGENLTEVRVRIGTFGDRGRSQAIMERIRQNL